MRKVIVGGFHQETNSFNPNTADAAYLGKFTFEGNRIFTLRDTPTPIGAFLEFLEEHDAEVVPSVFVFAQSGGRVEHSFLADISRQICGCIASEKPDAVFLMLHGATQTTETDDGCGFLLEELRKAAGPDVMIAGSLDMHANITERMLSNADVLCGYHKYPHIDTYETGLRTARLAWRMLEGETFCQSTVRLPMLRAASIYNTESGPVGRLTDFAAERAAGSGIADYTIYHMQPWLDVSEASSAVHVISEDQDKADAFAVEIAEYMWSIRGEIIPELLTVDEAIRMAQDNDTGKPFLLVDAADSPNAGSTGDNAYVLSRLLELAPHMPSAVAIKDERAAQRAFELGEGSEADFVIGGLYWPMSTSVNVRARVVSLHDGKFTAEGKMMKGTTHSMGKTAVLQAGGCRILVCTDMIGSGDPQSYRSCGIEPLDYKLVNIKACTSFRASYGDIAGKILEADTPGPASADVLRLPYKRIPMPFSPFEDPQDFKAVVLHTGR